MDFQINKKNTLEDFRNYVKKFDSREDKYRPKNAKRLSTPTPFFILDRIKSLFAWVLENSLLDLRRHYIHDDSGFKKARGVMDSYINNKIRIKKDGSLYLKVKDLEFNGDLEQYKEYIINNRTKLFSLIRMIVDEMNDVFSGNAPIDDNKVILSDLYGSSPTYNEWKNIIDKQKKLLDGIELESLDE